MTTEELRTLLIEEGFRSDSYCLEGGLPSEAYCLENRRSEWEVYYSERGDRSGERTFSSESEACANLLERLREDSSTKRSTP